MERIAKIFTSILFKYFLSIGYKNFVLGTCSMF